MKYTQVGQRLLKSQVFVPILIHLSIAIPLAFYLNIWMDEAYSLETTEYGLQRAIAQALGFENQPPLYFALLSLWRMINPSIFWARLLSILFSVLTIVVAAKVSQRYVPNLKPVYMAMVCAVHPFMIWAAVEIRPYPLVILLSFVILLLFFDAFWDQTKKATSKILYIIACILGLYTHYFILPLIIVNGLTILLTQKKKLMIKFIVISFFISLGFIPLIDQILNHATSQGTGLDFYDNRGISGFLKSIYSTNYLSANYIFPPYKFLKSIGLIRLFLIALISILVFIPINNLIKTNNPITESKGKVFYIWQVLKQNFNTFDIFSKIHSRKDRIQNLSYVNVFLLYWVSVVLFYITGTAPLAFRYGFTLFPVILIFFFAKFSPLYDSRHKIYRKIASILFVSIILFSSLTLLDTYQLVAKEGDWIRVSQFISANEKKDQPVFVFSGEQVLPFRRYYGGVNQVFPLPNDMGLEKFDLNQMALKSENEIEKYFSHFLGTKKDVWLIKAPNYVLNYDKKDYCILGNINLNCAFLDNYIKQYFDVPLQQKFYGAEVRLLHRK